MEPLPDELLLKILHHLGPEDLILASQVSETWNRVARDSTMWKQVALTVRNFPNSTNIQSYVARVIDIGWRMKELELDGVIAQYVDLDLLLPDLAVRCRNLTHLSIETSKGLNLNLLDNLASSLQSLKLTVNPNICDLKMIENFKNLNRLSISNVSSITDIVGNSDLSILSGVFKLKKLEVLTLEGFKALRLIAIGARSGKLGHLRQLALRRMMDYNMEHVRVVASRLPRLQYFEIDDTYDLVNEIEEIFISVSPQFENILFTSLPLLV